MMEMGKAAQASADEVAAAFRTLGSVIHSEPVVLQRRGPRGGPPPADFQIPKPGAGEVTLHSVPVCTTQTERRSDPRLLLALLAVLVGAFLFFQFIRGGQ